MTDGGFIEKAIAAGSRFFLFLEYTPVREATNEWLITEGQREEMRGIIKGYRKEHRAVFVAVPWDEEELAGCLASGRGFVHVSAAGDLEPRPFASFSDVNLKTAPLKVALQARFLKILRETSAGISENESGCTLWKNREMAGELMRQCMGKNGEPTEASLRQPIGEDAEKAEGQPRQTAVV